MELNKVLLVGTLGRDPEIRYQPSGDPIADFSVASNHVYKDRQGEQKKDTTWVNISCFGKTAEFCSNYLKKGTTIYIEGRLHYHAWETQDGQKRNKLDVIAERIQFAYPKSVVDGSSGRAPVEQASTAPAAANDGPPPESGREETVDDLPF